VSLPGATVVDLVAVRTSSFNTVQYQLRNRHWKHGSYEEQFWVENLAAKQVIAVIECY
jgi:uncharacterized membrane protein